MIVEIEDFAKESTKEFDSGHDWWHLHRVRNLALYLQKEEKKGDRFIIEVAALLHDIDDKKFRTEGKTGASEIISTLLQQCGLEEDIINEVILVNRHISFSFKEIQVEKSWELLIVQDADRLDAIGAIGIARAFNYGGFRNNPIYIPGETDSENLPSTIGHFYEKLLKLKDLMNTQTGRKLAEKRHLYLEQFLDQFYEEWNFTE